MAIFRGDGGSGDSTTDAYASQVAQDAQTASTKASEAAASATAAANSATAAAASESSVAANATAAAASASSASTSASSASSSESNAASSATSASTSATNAASSESNAATSESNAASSATTAATQASNASTSATNAANSATAAATSATNAAASESSVAANATAAAASETNAATSETNAASSATAAATSASNAATSESNASTSATNAANSATAASTSATNAATSETNASNSASAASTSATNAATSASAAATSESNAASSASSASTSATNASTSATNAASSATDAAALYDSFDDRYLGTKGSDPSTDNDGDSLVTGALYYNTSVGEMRVYTGSSWLAAYIPATGYLQLSGGTMTGALTLNADPSTNLQAATKQYVDTIAAASLHYHDPVRVEKEGNLSATYNNGSSGVGATLTNNSTQEALVIDGVTLSLNDRVLIYEQTDATQNGIYTVTDTGSVSTNWVLTRATDADSYAPSDPDSFGEGDAFYVLEGTLGAGELYVMNTSGTITFGTTNITFAQVSSAQVYTGGTGISISGSEISTTALLNVVEDTTPQLGGSLSANGYDINMCTYTITDTKVGQWDTAYSWGDHASAGYLTSFTETDPTVPSHVKSITTTEKANWNTAYGWGDHASAGYSTYTGSDAVKTTYNSSLNSDSRNSRGVTRLYRRDGDSDYSVQTYWTGARWRLYGYVGDSNHADTHVGYADAAATATTATNCSRIPLATGNYGTIKVNDDRGVTWAGYAIRDDWVFMSNGTGQSGIYDDTNNRWAIEWKNTTETKVTGYLTCTGNITAYSDERLKSDVETLDGSKVYEMRGVSFTKDGEQSSGVIAQELQKVAPELVNDSGEYLSVAYGNLVGYLIEAVKELKAEIEELKNGSSD